MEISLGIYLFIQISLCILYIIILVVKWMKTEELITSVENN
jgi:hypothetical protein